MAEYPTPTNAMAVPTRLKMGTSYDNTTPVIALGVCPCASAAVA